MICSGDNEAFGAPRFGDSDPEGVADSGGAGINEVDASGVGVGECFRFWRGDDVGVSPATALCFLVGDELGAGVGDSSALGECFFFGEADGVGVGVGDFLFVVLVVFFFRCGVGVGVAKIFFRVCPSVCSAASLSGTATAKHTIIINARRSM